MNLYLLQFIGKWVGFIILSIVTSLGVNVEENRIEIINENVTKNISVFTEVKDYQIIIAELYDPILARMIQIAPYAPSDAFDNWEQSIADYIEYHGCSNRITDFLSYEAWWMGNIGPTLAQELIRLTPQSHTMYLLLEDCIESAIPITWE